MSVIVTEPPYANTHFSALVEMVPHLSDRFAEGKGIFHAMLARLDAHQLSTMAVGIKTDDWYHVFNLAAFCVWHNKMIFLDIVLEKAPSLMWQSFIGDTEGAPLTTPLGAAAYVRCDCRFRSVLQHPCLVAYAETKPFEYACLTDKCSRLCSIWFGDRPASYKVQNITQELAEVANKTLCSYESTVRLLMQTPQEIENLQWPLETFYDAPRCVRHVDLNAAIHSASLLKKGASVSFIARHCVFYANEIRTFLYDPKNFSIERLHRLLDDMPDFIDIMAEVLLLRATHFCSIVRNSPNAQWTVLTLRFMRLDVLTGASCA